MAMRDYLATEVALDHVDGHLTRRDALRKLGLLGLSVVGASTLLAACARGLQRAAAARPDGLRGARCPGYDVAAALARTQPVTFPGAAGQLQGAFAPAEPAPKGAVLVVHENRGLTDHIKAVAGRLAGDGYSALAIDLLSRAGGTAAVPDATAALGQVPRPTWSPTCRPASPSSAAGCPGVPAGRGRVLLRRRHGVAAARRRHARSWPPPCRSTGHRRRPDLRRRQGRGARGLRRARRPGQRRQGQAGRRAEGRRR